VFGFSVDKESAAVTESTKTTKVGADDDTASTTDTALLLKTPEKLEKTEEIGTEFLLRDADREVTDQKDGVSGSAVVSSRRRKSRVDVDADQYDESGPGREMSDITADAMSIQPTGYTLETAHVRRFSSK